MAPKGAALVPGRWARALRGNPLLVQTELMVPGRDRLGLSVIE